MAWNEIAFSYGQIKEFLSIVALPHWEATEVLPFGSAPYRCFCTGFYFFAKAIQDELRPAFGDELLNLAVRVESVGNRPDNLLWDQYAEEARRLLAQYCPYFEVTVVSPETSTREAP